MGVADGQDEGPLFVAYTRRGRQRGTRRERGCAAGVRRRRGRPADWMVTMSRQGAWGRAGECLGDAGRPLRVQGRVDVHHRPAGPGPGSTRLSTRNLLATRDWRHVIATGRTQCGPAEGRGAGTCVGGLSSPRGPETRSRHRREHWACSAIDSDDSDLHTHVSMGRARLDATAANGQRRRAGDPPAGPGSPAARGSRRDGRAQPRGGCSPRGAAQRPRHAPTGPQAAPGAGPRRLRVRCRSRGRNGPTDRPVPPRRVDVAGLPGLYRRTGPAWAGRTGPGL